MNETEQDYLDLKDRVVAGMVEMLQLADRLELPPIRVQADFMAAFLAAAEAAASPSGVA